MANTSAGNVGQGDAILSYGDPLSAATAMAPSDWDPQTGMYGGSFQDAAANQNMLNSAAQAYSLGASKAGQAGQAGVASQTEQGQFALGNQARSLANTGTQVAGSAPTAAASNINTQRTMAANTAATQAALGTGQTALTSQANRAGQLGEYNAAQSQGAISGIANDIYDTSNRSNQLGLDASRQFANQGATANASLQNQGTTNAFIGNEFGKTSIGNVQGPTNLGMNEQQQAMQGLQSFAGQQAPNSVAQAQLRQATEQNAAQAMSLAASGRGGGASGAAQAQGMANAQAAGAQGAQSAAVLRAQEEQAWRNQQMQALGASAQVGAGLQGQSLAQSQQSLATQQAIANTRLNAGQTQLGYQNAALQAQQYGSQNQLAYNQLATGQQLNYTQLAAQQQQAALQGNIAAQQQGYQYNQLGTQAGLQYANMSNQDLLAAQNLSQQNAQFSAGTQAQTGLGYGQLGAQYAGLGAQYAGMSNQDILAQQSLGQQNAQFNANLGLQANAQAGQLDQGFTTLGQQQLMNQASNNTQGSLGVMNAQTQVGMSNAKNISDANAGDMAMVGGAMSMIGGLL